MAIYLGGEDAGPQLEKGLVAHWKFSPGTDLKDSSPNSYDGTAAGAAAVDEADRKGQGTQALGLDGDGDYVTTTNAFDGTLPISISLWARTAAYPTPEPWAALLRLESYVAIEVGTSGALNVAYDDTSLEVAGIFSDSTSGTLSLNTWYHIVVVLTETSTPDLKVYLDGTESGSLTASGGNHSGGSNTATLEIGNNGIDREYTGRIDDVRVYNRALSTTEITSLYDSYNPGAVVGDLQKGLVAHWKFDDGTLEDSTPNSYDATLENQAAVTAADRKGESNSALTLDGTDDYVSVSVGGSEFPVVTAFPFTLTAWVYREVANGDILWVGKGDANYTYSSIRIAGGKIEAKSENGWSNDDRTATVATVFPLNTWVFAAGVFNSTSSRKAYLNDLAPDENTTGIPSIGTYNRTNMGRHARSLHQNYLQGRIDDARIYNRALTDAEVIQLYDSYKPDIVMNRGPMDILGSTGSIIPLINSEFPATSSTFETRGEASAKTFTWAPGAPSTFDTAPSKVNGVDIVTFNNSDELANSPDATYWSPLSEAFSVGAWVNFSEATESTILSKWDLYWSSNREWSFQTTSADKVTLALWDETNTAQIGRLTPSASQNVWAFYVATFDGGTVSSGIKVYKDGSQADNADNESGAGFVTMRNEPSLMKVGYDHEDPIDPSKEFGGSMAGGEIGPFFVQKELTAAEVTELYDYGKRKLGL